MATFQSDSRGHSRVMKFSSASNFLISLCAPSNLFSSSLVHLEMSSRALERRFSSNSLSSLNFSRSPVSSSAADAAAMMAVWTGPNIVTNPYGTARARATDSSQLPGNWKKIGTCRGTCAYCAIFIGTIWCTLEPLSCTLKWTCTLNKNRIPFWVLCQQMLTEIQTCKGSHDTQNLLKTKQIAKPALKVKINSMLLKAIKIIGPWMYLYMYKT